MRATDPPSDEVTVAGLMAGDLGISPEIWLLGTLLFSASLFFKFARFWSVRNLDLVLVFAPAPGLLTLVRHPSPVPWVAFWWLFLGSLVLMIRCLVDLGLVRRPQLEANLNTSGLACLAIGMVSLFVAETIRLPIADGLRRNPADSKREQTPEAPPGESVVEHAIQQFPFGTLTPQERPRDFLKRAVATAAHVVLVLGLIGIGRSHFGRVSAGLAVATGYLILPYARFALVDTGQLLPASLIVLGLYFIQRPALVGVFLGLAAGWMPTCLGLLPLWASYYRRDGLVRFVGTALGVVAACAVAGFALPSLSPWARALGARSLAEVGLLPGLESPTSQSFWATIDAHYRIPVLIVYLVLTIVLTAWPRDKNLGELIAISAANLIASQFWCLEAGGTFVVLYLPLILLMMFRPNLAFRRARRQHTPTPKTVPGAVATD